MLSALEVELGNLDDAQSLVCLLELPQLGLDRLDRIRCVVSEVDGDLVGG